jgi:phosphoserine phosphatase RsbU/P
MEIEKAAIVVMSGADDGKAFIFEKTPFTIGRLPDDDVSIPYDNRTSRHHAKISREGNAYFIEDVGPDGKGSTNGTYINYKKITGKTLLSSREMILVGAVWVKFDTISPK